jgi:hypothetical protein
VNYIQCSLEVKLSNRYIKTQSWIPRHYAKVGKIIDLKYRDEWIKGWKVIDVYKEVEIDEEEAIKQRNYYKNHRIFSDV